jgi:hypothetical protein
MSNWTSKANWKDPNWKYVPASQTNIAETIARVKKEMEKNCRPKITKTKGG